MNIIRVLMNREDYDKYRKYIPESSTTREEWKIIQGIDKYYSDYPKVTAIEEDFKTFFSLVFPEGRKVMSSSSSGLYSDMLDRLLDDEDGEEDESITDIRKALLDVRWKNTISEKVLDVTAGESTLGDVYSLMEEWKREVELDTDAEKGLIDFSDIKGMIRRTLGAGGLDWALAELRIALGPLRKSNFIIVGGRPDSGKTTFLANNAVYMAGQLPDEPARVLWFNNEGDGEAVGLRIIQSALSIDTETLNSIDAEAEYSKVMSPKDKIMMKDDSSLTVADAERLITKFQPDLIIFDQLWKVYGFERKSSNDVTRISNLFNWARGISKDYAPVITVHQLDGSAEGVKWVDQSHFHMSKTGIQGEADAIITIGRTGDDKESNMRFIYVPKNKLPGGPKSDPSRRNGKFIVEMDAEYARFKSLL